MLFIYTPYRPLCIRYVQKINNVSIRQANSAPEAHHSHACDNSVSDTSEYPILKTSHLLLAEYVLTSRLDPSPLH